MKNKNCFLVTLLLILMWTNANAQTRVQIGDLYYELSGAYASVASSRPIPIDCRSPQASLYTKETYIIPSVVTYNGMDYTVTEIGEAAFAGWSNWNASPYFDSIYAIGSKAKKIVLPPTIKKIGKYAFANCRDLTSLIIPENVTSFFDGTVFLNCDLLRDVFYLPATSPSNWYAASNTYVPTLDPYKSPSYSGNGATIKEYISFTSKEFTYTGAIPNVEWVNNVTGYEAEVDLSNIKKEVGVYNEKIPIKLTKGDDVIEAYVIFKYTIKAASLLVTVNDASRVYGDENPQFTYTVSGFINGDDSSIFSSNPNITTTATKKSDVGTYNITASGCTAPNYSITYKPGILTISKAPLNAKINDVSRVYGDHNPSFSMSYEGLKNGETTPTWITTPNYSIEANSQSTIGNYDITAIAVACNYDIQEIQKGVLTIKPAPLTIIANNVSRTYYEENPQFTYQCNGFKNNENASILLIEPTLSSSANRKSSAGTYDIEVSGASASNYDISYSKGTLTVMKRPLNVSVGNYARDFNSENPEFTLDYTGFVNGEDIRVIDTKPYAYTSAKKDSNVGTYTINITGGEDNNYSFYYNSGELTINKAEQDLIWNQDLNNLAIGEQVKLLAEATSGLEITYSLDQNEICEVYSTGKSVYLDCKSEGEFQIRASQEGNGNYYATPRITKKIFISSGGLEKPTLTIKQADIGSISTKVERGSVYEFTITPEENWLIHSVSFNGNDYTNKIDKTNTFTTPQITNNSTIIIVYSQAPSGISHNEMSTIRITGTQNGIKVDNADFGTEAYIYTIDGSLIKSQEIKSSSEEIKLENNKLYIIKIGTFTSKVRL